ncbi:alpha/beta hydrolase [Skermanella stibiiresistens]|uniref:alpha/beta hydrolase n=1 Tax=Skermanella stibiiresistens TaxID=913326 RepID=UPI0004B743B7|nr:alpha/beta hydrolase-fold protein [Skermanella stibiiresistens]
MKRLRLGIATLAKAVGMSAGVGAGVMAGAMAGILIGTTVGTTAAMAGTVLERSLPSPTLGRDYRFTVYLPDGYGESCLSYPVLYLLHGANGDEHDWLNKGKIKPTLDRLINDDAITPMIVVMPGHKQMWWVDANAEKAGTVLMKELLPRIEQDFRIVEGRAGRMVAGLSAGGQAAVRLAFEHPEMFAAAAALSPAVYEPLPPSNSSAMKDPPFQKDGKFDGEAWAKLSWRPLFETYRAQPVVVPFYINSGDIDRFEIPYHAAALFRELHRHQPGNAIFRVVAGDHEWPVWASTIGDALEYMSPHARTPIEADPARCGAAK